MDVIAEGRKRHVCKVLCVCADNVARFGANLACHLVFDHRNADCVVYPLRVTLWIVFTSRVLIAMSVYSGTHDTYTLTRTNT
jgi:hypothetical protein